MGGLNWLRILSTALSLLFWSNCTTTRESPTPVDKTALSVVGTMHYLEIEGGCWQFRSDAGEYYDLVGNLTKQLYVEGQRSQITIRLRPDLASICMVGTIAEVVEINHIF